MKALPEAVRRCAEETRVGWHKGTLADAQPEETWKALTSEPNAVLVDVRTTAEWNYVGLPDVSALGAPLYRVEWQSFPSGAVDPAFVETAFGEFEGGGYACRRADLLHLSLRRPQRLCGEGDDGRRLFALLQRRGRLRRRA